MSVTTALTESGDILILDDVPIPHRAERRTYPFAKLDVNQCFMVECEDIRHERSVRSSATRWNKNDEGKRYIVRRIEDTESTVGVWRIS
tara:strand:+ start:252 stop:518 length:267 start_codon:yes stop_codon:yes gene_type:complete